MRDVLEQIKRRRVWVRLPLSMRWEDIVRVRDEPGVEFRVEKSESKTEVWARYVG